MLPSSAKQKGRNLQKYVVEHILKWFPDLKPDDVTSRSMGSAGEDILLSPKARECLPISIECKNNAKHAVYKFYEQAKTNAKGYQPIVIIKQNNSKPLAVMDLGYYLYLESMHHEREEESNSEEFEYQQAESYSRQEE